MPSSVSTYVRALKPVFSVGWVFSICRRVTLERSPELLAAAKPPRRKPNRHSTLIKKVKYRKEEYKIEVLIPPNISDPLNLNAEDDSDYEAKLVSPLLKKKKVSPPC